MSKFSRQLELKILFLLHSLPQEWVSQEDLLKMLGRDFPTEAGELIRKGLVLCKSKQVRLVSVDNFFKLTTRGKEEATGIILSR